MTPSSIMMVGGPDSGKSNYLARLWAALDAKECDLYAPQPPEKIAYVEALLNHLNRGHFVPRSEHQLEDASNDLKISIACRSDVSVSAEIHIPDIHGEVWKKAVTRWELPEVWYERLKEASGALLFVRAHSELNHAPLDLVTSQELLKSFGNDEKRANEVPTQVALAELLRILEENLLWIDDTPPRVAVVVTAWDSLSAQERQAGPLEYLAKEFPLFAGRIKDDLNVDLNVYAVSILGGDVVEAEFKQRVLADGVTGLGYAVDGQTSVTGDISLPIKWLLRK